MHTPHSSLHKPTSHSLSKAIIYLIVSHERCETEQANDPLSFERPDFADCRARLYRDTKRGPALAGTLGPAACPPPQPPTANSPHIRRPLGITVCSGDGWDTGSQLPRSLVKSLTS